MNRLDSIAVWMMAVIIALVVGAFISWLLAGAVLAFVHGWRTRQRDLAITACVLPVVFWVTWGIGQHVASRLPLHMMDAAFARLDHGVGIGVWHWCTHHPESMLVLYPTYAGLGVPMMLAVAFTGRRRELLTAFVLATLAGWACYLIFPAVGPRWVGRGSFPNCMPSLHLTFALLSWIYVGRWLRIPMFLFVLLTAVATMGTGEHYAIDLVAALPFTVAVCWLAKRSLRFNPDPGEALAPVTVSR